MSSGQKLQHLLSPTELTRLRDVAERHHPRTVREAVDVIDLLGFTQAMYRRAIKLLNVLNAADLKNVLMREILASKMVQRTISLKVLFECMHGLDLDNPALATSDHSRVRNLPSTGVKGRKFHLPANRLYWLDGDVPLYTDDGRIVPGAPPLDDKNQRVAVNLPDPQGHAIVTETTKPHVNAMAVEMNHVNENDNENENENQVNLQEPDADADRELYTIPDFEDSEYCRLLHALADRKMASHLSGLMDATKCDNIWRTKVALIFNDTRFQPSPVRSLSGGVSKTDIADLRPVFVRERDGETLQNKFAEFKSLYRAAVRSYVQFGNDDTDTFSDFCQGRKYVMYAFCLLENYPKLEPITLKSLSNEKGGTPSGQSSHVTQKRSAPEEAEFEHDVPDSPVPKRVKAALLQGAERAELSKIIKGGEPGEVVADHGMAGITTAPVEGLTKSEVVQQVERAEREKENMEHLMASRFIDGRSERQGPSLLISQPRSAALEEIESYARERAMIETRNARVNYTSSLLVAIREVNLAIKEASRDNQEKRLFTDLRDNLLQSLSQSAIQDFG